MPTGKGSGFSLLANKKQYKAMTINRKMRIQNKMNQLRTRADIYMAEIRRRNMKERKNVE
jgi:hypothetical protein